jgi:predicted transcriptional regulator
MEVPLTPELDNKLRRVASQTGRTVSQVVQELIAKYVEHDEWFRSEVEKGIASLDRGDFVSDEEVRQRVERALRSR